MSFWSGLTWTLENFTNLLDILLIFTFLMRNIAKKETRVNLFKLFPKLGVQKVCCAVFNYTLF